ncbi:MAG: CBS domain-containing protein [Candidatus Hydrothermarchaeales archaeon]
MKTVETTPLEENSLEVFDRVIFPFKRNEMKGALDQEGSVMALSKTEVVTIPPTMSIKGAAETMTRYRFRRLPVTDPGTNRLLGIIGSSDIIDFLGGGDKFKVIKKKHKGNFLAAINESVREIMMQDVVSLDASATLDDGLKTLLSSRVGGVVITQNNRVVGILTEKDFVSLMAEKVTGKKVEDYMTRNVVSATLGMTLGDVAKTMTRNSFRRLPVLSKGDLIGIITTRHIVDFIGRNSVFAKIVKNEVQEVLKTRAREIMDENVAVVSKDTDIGEAAKIMRERKTGTVCVVDNGRLVGILTERDIVRAVGE